jgi:hypothetical protein
MNMYEGALIVKPWACSAHGSGDAFQLDQKSLLGPRSHEGQISFPLHISHSELDQVALDIHHGQSSARRAKTAIGSPRSPLAVAALSPPARSKWKPML